MEYEEHEVRDLLDLEIPKKEKKKKIKEKDNSKMLCWNCRELGQLCEGMSRTKHAKGNRSGHMSEM
jgi:hypothetical protein